MASYYSHTGPSIDPELLTRMLLVGYCYGVRSERKLCEEVSLNLAYRWFYRLDLDAVVPDHSSFSKNRHGRAPNSDLLRLVFEWVVGICGARSRSPQRAVREYLDALDHSEGLEADRKIPKLLSLPGPASAWTAKANKRVQFGYGLSCNARQLANGLTARKAAARIKVGKTALYNALQRSSDE